MSSHDLYSQLICRNSIVPEVIFFVEIILAANIYFCKFVGILDEREYNRAWFVRLMRIS